MIRLSKIICQQRNAADALCLALKADNDLANLTPQQEVRLLHILE